jgi:hypothetical protein
MKIENGLTNSQFSCEFCLKLRTTPSAPLRNGTLRGGEWVSITERDRLPFTDRPLLSRNSASISVWIPNSFRFSARTVAIALPSGRCIWLVRRPTEPISKNSRCPAPAPAAFWTLACPRGTAEFTLSPRMRIDNGT